MSPTQSNGIFLTDLHSVAHTNWNLLCAGLSFLSGDFENLYPWMDVGYWLGWG